ncbi:MAG: Rod binding domain-containing protein [Candidatus Paceibacteria bacterium]
MELNTSNLFSASARLPLQDSPAPQVGGDHEAAGKQFEALMATMLVKEMRKALPNGFFGKGPGSETFGGWLDKSIGDSLADSWNLDIAGMVKTSLDTKQARLGVEGGAL